MSAREREAGGRIEPATLPSVSPLLPVAVSPQPVQPDGPVSQPGLFFNRDLSWLDFNWRMVATSCVSPRRTVARVPTRNR
ncbi:MAG: hypothetical protein ACREMA_18840 [Longimicrobiales bacterium]